jgi:hypothetical protein
MFSFFCSAKPAPAVTRRRLMLESLESRDCPSQFMPMGSVPVDLNPLYQTQQNSGGSHSPIVLNYSLSYGINHDVNVVGTVTGPGAAGAQIEFEGPINGIAITTSDGSFDFTTSAQYLGNLLAGVIQGSTVVSNIAADLVNNVAPVIQNFTWVKLDNTTYEFTGKVIDEHPGGLVVNFGGAPQSLQGKTAVVNNDGTFSLVVTMSNTSSDVGNADVQIAYDWWGATSQYAFMYVN